MLEATIEILRTVPWFWVLIFAFFITLIENVFPPSPSDAILLFIGTLVGIGTIGFFPLLISSTLGSIAGFAIMYHLGDKFEHIVMDSNRFKFISRELIAKVEKWFDKYGLWLVIANRFLSGTRAVIAFFVGMSHLPFKKTLILSACSALVWNAFLIYFGMKLGNNWQNFNKFLADYGFYVGIATLVIIIYFILKWIIKRVVEKEKI